MRGAPSRAAGVGGNANSGFYWIVSPELIANNLDRWWESFMGIVVSGLEDVGQKITSYSKSAHPWNNITGAAERSLNTKVHTEGGNVVILHYADPGIDAEGARHVFWMEVRWNGRYGIIRISLQNHYDDVMAVLRMAVKGARIASRF
jgi:hypothetical protein